MIYSARQSVHGFTGSGFEIHYGVIPQKRLSFRVLLAVFLALNLGLALVLYKTHHINYELSSSVTSGGSAVSAAALDTSNNASPENPADPPSAAAASVRDNSHVLQQTVDNWVAAHSSHQWSVSMSGLRGDPSHADSKGLEARNMASIYKLLMLYPLTLKTPRAQWGSVSLSAAGTKQTLAACVEAMMLKSDNPCGEAVATYVGWVKADKQLADLGLTHTYLDRSMNGTSQDINSYLQLMDQGKLFTAEDTAYFKSLMQKQRYRQGMPAGCSGCTVSDKTGDIGTARNDAGIIETGGRAYSLVIMSNGGSYAEIADLTRAINTLMTP